MALYNPEEENADSVLAHFIKKEHLESFLSGNLFLSHFATYRRLQQDGTGRADPNEGTKSLSSASKTKLFVGIEKEYGKAAPLSECSELTGLINLVSIKMSETEHCHIFSLTSGVVVENDIRFDPSLGNDRDFIIIIEDFTAFFKRIEQSVLGLGLNYHVDYIEYFEVDDKPTKHPIFTKTIEFKDQREFRLVVTGHPNNDQLKLSLGNLKEIVRVFEIRRAQVEGVHKAGVNHVF